MSIKKYDFDEEMAKAKATFSALMLGSPHSLPAAKPARIIVLEALKPEIIALQNQGYSLAQIAQALRSNDFGIIPKTLMKVLEIQADKRQAKAPKRAEKPAVEPMAKIATKTGAKPVIEPMQKPAVAPTKNNDFFNEHAVPKSANFIVDSDDFSK